MTAFSYNTRYPVKKGSRWHLRQPDEDIVAHVRTASGVSDMLARVLVNRGFFDADAVMRFTRAQLALLYDPFRLSGMTAAVHRLYAAIDAHERVTIYGDYDVDGVTATALLVRVLRRLGANIDYFIPCRSSQGYGLHVPTLKELARDGTRVVVTVDCGISAIEPVRVAQQLGVDVIITDHHEPRINGNEVDDFDTSPEMPLFDYVLDTHEDTQQLRSSTHMLPPACAIINPKLGRYPFPDLAGVGVAFKLAHGLVKMGRENGCAAAEDVDLHHHLDLVALGTLADAVPLRDENRILVVHGLPMLEKSHKPGIHALCQVADVRTCSVESVVFRLAPRINAAGRMTHAETALRLLVTDDAAEAHECARELEYLNTTRQKVERETFRDAVDTFEKTLPVTLPKTPKLPGGLQAYMDDIPHVIVLASKEWNPGVVGIVASRMVERYYLPSVIIALNGEKGHGSCRSIAEFHMFEALCTCQDILERFGGHRVAAGLTIRETQVDALRTRLDTLARTRLEQEEYVPALYIDAETRLEECTLEHVEELELCKPYGQSNPRPLFVIRGVKIVEDPCVYKDKHVKLCVLQGSTHQHIIGFNWIDRLQEMLLWATMDIVVYPYRDIYRGMPRVEMQLIDAQEAQ